MSEAQRNESQQADTLRLIYEDILRERDRLRDERKFVTRQLGPTPAAGALIIALVLTSKNL